MHQRNVLVGLIYVADQLQSRKELRLHIPEVIGVSGGDHALGLLRITARSWPFRIAKHPAHGCWGKMKTGTSEDLGDLHFSEGGQRTFRRLTTWPPRTMQE
jgi:hypothetical protein